MQSTGCTSSTGHLTKSVSLLWVDICFIKTKLKKEILFRYNYTST